MPINTRILTKQNPQAGGLWRVHEEHTDLLGRRFYFRYLTDSENRIYDQVDQWALY
jgi:hypothetical protein